MVASLRTRRSQRISESAKVSDDESNSVKTHSNGVGARLRKKRKISEDASDDEESRGTSLTVREEMDGRPFELISGLPSSQEIPQYNSALVHPLSVINSGVLYKSLVNSRNTWINGEMFDLYYTKNLKNGDNEGVDGKNILVREKMQKMCDCTMLGGPHTFPVRLFIFKNDRIEEKWEQEQEIQRLKREELKKNFLEEKKNKLMEKKKKQQLKKEQKEKEQSIKKELREKQKAEQQILKVKRKEEQKKIKEEQKRLKLEQKIVKEEQLKKLKEEQRKTKLEQQSKSKQVYNKDKPKPVDKKNEDVSNSRMIANLNMMAQNDPKVNNLMMIVSKGEATKEQVAQFKRYMEVAKKLPSTSSHILKPRKNESNGSNGSNDSNDSKDSKNTDVSTDSKNPKDSNDANGTDPTNDGSISNDSHKLPIDKPAMDKDDKIKSIDVNKEIKAEETTNETKEGLPSNKVDENLTVQKHLELNKNDTDSSINDKEADDTKNEVKDEKSDNEDSRVSDKISEVKSEAKEDDEIVIPKRKYRKKKDMAKEDEEKEMQLTAFQQKYVDESELAIEFQEYVICRYTLPREAIIEYLEGTNEYIYSWMLVHNRKEITRYKNRRIKELTKNIKNEDERKAIVEEFNVYDDRNCPTPLYTPMTVILKDIHKKYSQIVIHSIEPLEKVQKLMASIIAVGTRLSGYNLWYQLDGYEDKNLAEKIRSELVEYENGLKGRKSRK